MFASSAPHRSQYHSLGVFMAPHSAHLSVFRLSDTDDVRSVSSESLVTCTGGGAGGGSGGFPEPARPALVSAVS